MTTGSWIVKRCCSSPEGDDDILDLGYNSGGGEKFEHRHIMKVE